MPAIGIRPTALVCVSLLASASILANSPERQNLGLLGAIRNGDQRAAETFLSQGANPNARDDRGSTALMQATLNADVEMMQLLLSKGADVSARDQSGATSLLWALHDAEKAKLLLDHGAKVSEESVFTSVAIPGARPVLDLLASHGANFNIHRNGFTPLMAAARSGSIETTRFLIDKGVDVRARTRSGYTALYGAASWPGSASIVRLLLERGADPNVHVDVTEPAPGVFTPLMAAAGRGDAQTVKILLDRGADVHVHGGRFDRSALLLAATAGSEETVKLLLARGADINAQDAHGDSPLQWAWRRGDTNIAMELAKAGAKERSGSLASNALPAPRERSEPNAIKRAISNSLPLLQHSAQTFSERKNCVSCHHQPLVAMAVAAARSYGVEVDERMASQEQVRVLEIMAKSRPNILLGSGVTDELAPAYILAGLAATGQPSNEITDALVHFLILRQRTDGSWSTPVYRPPQDASDVTFTALAVHGLQLFAPKGRAKEIRARIERARTWLVQSQPGETEESAFRLLGLRWSHADAAHVNEAVTALLQQQRGDGGWGQLPTLPSDAYATGLALYALHEGGGLAAGHPAYRRGVEYLLKTQREDGSWFVQTRSFPIQPFVSTAFPHGKSQFISVAGTCWASIGLSLTKE